MAEKDKNQIDQIVCYALIEGDDVLVFDAEGEVKRFRLEGDKRKRLCFSTHGHEDAAGFLTPCFDDEGIHGVPEESCFCGVDEPHLHAHYRDEKTCSDTNQDKDFSYLARLILTSTDKESQKPVLQHSSALPNKCNSNEWTSHLTKAGVESKSSHGTDTALGQRMFKVNHGDHQDFLVHNSNTGDLHLEHECNDCGETDLHGRLQHLSTRRLEGRVELRIYEVTPVPFSVFDFFATLFDLSSTRVHVARDLMPRAPSPSHEKKAGCCKSHAAHAGDANPTCTSRVHVAGDLMPRAPSPSHEKKAGCCKSHAAHAGDANPTCTSRVHVAGDLMPRAPSPSHETKTHCCKSHAAHAGDANPTCNAGPCHASQTIDCEDTCCGTGHPPNPCDSNGCCDSKKDCCETGADSSCCDSGVCLADSAKGTQPGSRANSVRSSFTCKNICCSSEVPVVREILEEEDGVENVMVNVALKQVTVDHQPEMISAKEMNSILNKNGLGASIIRDGEIEAKPTREDVGRSHFYVEKICCASEIPMINRIVKPIHGVLDVSINVTNKLVYVDHELHEVSAQQICDALNRDRFGAEVKKDAGETFLASLDGLVESALSYTPATEANAGALEDFLLTVDQKMLSEFVVDGCGGTFKITHSPLLLPAASLANAVSTKLGITCTVDEDGARGMYHQDDDDKEGSLTDERMSWPPIPTILSCTFWVISMLSLIGGNWEYLKYTALVSVTFGLPSILLKALGTLRRCQFDTNCLMSLSVIGALALGEYTEAAAVTSLYSISEWLEVRATTRARNALSAIVRLRPEKANLILPNSKEMVTVRAAAVPVGAQVSVRPGDKVPCDGEVVQGRSTVDESSLTGEARPVKKGPGDKVSGGTINSGLSELTIRTTATADNSAVAKLIRLVEEAQANRSETEKLVDEFAKRYTPLVILGALCMCTIPWIFGKETGRFWTYNGLVLLVVACPCALIISTPVTYVAGLAATAQKGILIKGGAHLEALAMVGQIFFDKTGTLSRGCFALLHMKVFSEALSRKEVLEYLALIEERASHPLAQAIMDGIRNEGVSIPKSISMTQHTQLPGEGVSAIIGGSKVCVGNERLFKRIQQFDTIPIEIRKEAEAWSEAGGTVGFVSIGEHGVVCAYCVADDVREESATVVRQLETMGVETTMLTGDNDDAALAIGAQVGLHKDRIRSQLFPEEKLNIVKGAKESGYGTSSVFSNPFKKQSLVLMCGDGVNDAPALATADVGVAMGAGAALAMESSDVTLLDSNLTKLVYALQMGRRVVRKIRENVLFSFVVKAVVVVFTLVGKVELWAAIAADVGAMLVVTLNGMLLLPNKKDREEKVSVQSFAEAAKDLDAESGANDARTVRTGRSSY